MKDEARGGLRERKEVMRGKERENDVPPTAAH